MFYEPDKNDHGLPYSPFKSCVVPRPIGWISTRSRDGRVNLAPFSQFNALDYDPPYVIIAANGRTREGGRKDTILNIEETGEFVFNIVPYALRDAMNTTALIGDGNVDEMAAAGLHAAPSVLVKPPRVAESPIHFECRHYQTLVLPGNTPETITHAAIGRVVGIHIDDDMITADGRVDILRIRPIARLGYMDYTSVESVFSLHYHNEDDPEFYASGLIGDASPRR